MIIDPTTTPVPELHQYLVGAVAPRPIAFVSTVDDKGITNLAPYSFFNVFSSNPPIAVFSSNRRVGNNTTKDTLRNVELTRECVINVVTFPIVRQMALASIDYPSDVSEFDKGGFTPVPSDLVKPPRVLESPVNMECKVKDIVPLGEEGGAGHLVICEVVRMHLDEAILDAEGRIDPDKIDLMGRLGRAFYTRASGSSIIKIFQPFHIQGVGFDGLPEFIVKSRILTGNEIAEVAALPELPTVDPELRATMISKTYDAIERHAQILIQEGKPAEAAALLLSCHPQE